MSADPTGTDLATYEGEGPAQARTRFVLMAPARSGSTMLREILNNHPEISCHGEILGQRIRGIPKDSEWRKRLMELEAIRARNLLRFADQHIFGGPLPVAGFKLLHSQPRVEIAELFEALIADAEIRIIFLWRRDLVSRLASYVTHVQGRKTVGRLDEATGVSHLDVEMAAQDCRNQILAARRHARLFSDHPCMSVEYEALLSHPGEELDRIAGFLGVASGRMRLPPKPPPGPKQGPSIENLDAVRASPLVAPYLDYAWSDVVGPA